MREWQLYAMLTMWLILITVPICCLWGRPADLLHTLAHINFFPSRLYCVSTNFRRLLKTIIKSIVTHLKLYLTVGKWKLMTGRH